MSNVQAIVVSAASGVMSTSGAQCRGGDASYRHSILHDTGLSLNSNIGALPRFVAAFLLIVLLQTSL